MTLVAEVRLSKLSMQETQLLSFCIVYSVSPLCL